MKHLGFIFNVIGSLAALAYPALTLSKEYDVIWSRNKKDNMILEGKRIYLDETINLTEYKQLIMSNCNVVYKRGLKYIIYDNSVIRNNSISIVNSTFKLERFIY